MGSVMNFLFETNKETSRNQRNGMKFHQDYGWNLMKGNLKRIKRKEYETTNIKNPVCFSIKEMNRVKEEKVLCV